MEKIAIPSFTALLVGALRGVPARRGYVENGLPFSTRGKAFPS